MVPFWESVLKGYRDRCRYRYKLIIWVVVKIMVPFWVLSIIRHLVFRIPKREHNFENHPYRVLNRNPLVLGMANQGFLNQVPTLSWNPVACIMTPGFVYKPDGREVVHGVDGSLPEDGWIRTVCAITTDGH